jgi:hypothetical protein
MKKCSPVKIRYNIKAIFLYLYPRYNRFRLVRRLATSATLLLKSIGNEEDAAALAGARYSPSRRIRTAAAMELLDGIMDTKESAEVIDTRANADEDDGDVILAYEYFA